MKWIVFEDIIEIKGQDRNIMINTSNKDIIIFEYHALIDLKLNQLGSWMGI